MRKYEWLEQEITEEGFIHKFLTKDTERERNRVLFVGIPLRKELVVIVKKD